MTTNIEGYNSNIPQPLSYTCPTIAKISVCVLGVLLVGGCGCLFTLSSVNAIVSYTGWGVGGCLVIGTIIFSVIDHLYAKRTVAQVFEREQTLQRFHSWKSDYKNSALTALQSTQSSTTLPKDLTLFSEHIETLKTAVQRLNKCDRNAATIYSEKGMWVFSLPDIPDRIFKMRKKYSDCGEDLTKRITDTDEARKIIQQENLYLLHVPTQQIIQVEGCELLMEERLDVIHSQHNQKSLYEYCQSDPELIPVFLESVRQLITLILKFGYSDVRYDNNPLLSNGQGFALIDLDRNHYLRNALVTGCAGGERDGILGCLSTEILDKLRPWLETQLTQKQLDEIKIDQIRETRRQTEERNQQFSQFLQSKGIVTGKESVKLHSWQLSESYESKKIAETENRINELAQNNLGLHLPSERTFFIYANPPTAQLDKLKQEGKIFDWFERDRGYYVLC